jgi:hypothetical protein
MIGMVFGIAGALLAHREARFRGAEAAKSRCQSFGLVPVQVLGASIFGSLGQLIMLIWPGPSVSVLYGPRFPLASARVHSS